MYLAIILIPNNAQNSETTLMVIKYGLIIFGTLACMFILYDYFPARLDSLTDGHRITLLSKRINVEAYNVY